MATRCPWASHNARPDPATLGLGKNERGLCVTCHLRYVVAETNPHRLDRLVGESALTILALSRKGLAPDVYRELLGDTKVRGALRRKGLLG